MKRIIARFKRSFLYAITLLTYTWITNREFRRECYEEMYGEEL